MPLTARFAPGRVHAVFATDLAELGLDADAGGVTPLDDRSRLEPVLVSGTRDFETWRRFCN